jgi:hypothetical protein
VLGIDPNPYTLAQLQTMARGRQKSEWAQTSTVLCLLANANRDKKRRPYPFEPDDFNPFAEYRGPRGIPFDKTTSRILAQAMTGKELPSEPTRWDLLTSKG